METNSPSPVTGNFTTSTSSITIDPDNKGAFVKTLHTSREVKIYGLLETEIENLTNIGREQRLWSSIGAASFALLLGCIWDMSNVADDSNIPRVSYVLVTVFVIATLFSMLKSFQYWLRQKSALADLIPDKNIPLTIQIKDRILTCILNRLPKI